jgi:RimJ/RimL family protein N-acetyltransferase
MKLETPRLILRKPRKSDWKDIYEACQSKKITDFTFVPLNYKPKDAKKFIEETQKSWKTKEKYLFVLELRKEKKVIGVLGIHRIDKRSNKAETVSWMNPKYHRKGYMFEAKLFFNDFVFKKLKLNRMETGVMAPNKASIATQKSVGYKYEGTRKQAIKTKSNKYADEIEFGLLKKDWKKNLPKLKKKLDKKLKFLEH